MMKSEKLILETPYGTRDLLPRDAAEMRHMEDMMKSLLRPSNIWRPWYHASRRRIPSLCCLGIKINSLPSAMK